MYNVYTFTTNNSKSQGIRRCIVVSLGILIQYIANFYFALLETNVAKVNRNTFMYIIEIQRFI